MASWGIGDDHDSDEVFTLKKQLLEKDAFNDTLRSQLRKKEEEISDIKTSTNEVIDRLRREADKVVHLEETLQNHTAELKKERVTKANTETSLQTLEQKLKESEQTTRELQSTVEHLSMRVDSSSRERTKVAQENAELRSQVRTLQLEVQARDQTIFSQSQKAQDLASGSKGRRRSSSASHLRISALEGEIGQLRTEKQERDEKIIDLSSRLEQAQTSLYKVENEKIALEKSSQRQLQELRSTLEERDEELQTLRGAGAEDAADQEARLLERLDEEEAKVSALESQLDRMTRTQKKEVEMLIAEHNRAQELLQDKTQQLEQSESRMSELVAEKEQAFDDRDRIQQGADELRAALEELQNRLFNSLPLPPAPPSPSPETEATLQRLVQMIERLRGERDQLRRNLEFIQLEDRCTIEDLRTKLAAASAAAVSHETLLQPNQSRELGAQLCRQLTSREQAMLALSLVVQHMESEQAALDLRVDTLSTGLAHREHELQNTQDALRRSQTLSDDSRTLRGQLENATQGLAAARSQITYLEATINDKDDELSRERGAHEETGCSLAQIESQLSDMHRVVADLEAERDALSLQVKHTEQDLQKVQDELAEADARYGQQLQHMSTGQQTRALQGQIAVLEGRILRRTEQIGLHQHDIKRLETNLRLQEERLSEMAAELEVTMGEKEALVEDCRNTREERDDALMRCEQMEENTDQSEQCRARETEALVKVIFSAAVKQRHVAGQIKALWARHLQADTQNQATLQAAESQVTHLMESTAQAVAERDQALALLEQQSHNSTALLAERDATNEQVIQATVALALCHRDLRQVQQLAEDNLELRKSAESQIQKLQQDLQANGDTISSLQAQIQSSSDEHVQLRTSESARFADLQVTLEAEVQALKTANAEIQSRHEQDIAALAEAKDELKKYIEDRASYSQQEAALREELDNLRVSHEEEVSRLSTELDQVSAELQAARRAQEESDVSHDATHANLAKAKEELERQLADATFKLECFEHNSDELTALEEHHKAQVNDLQTRLHDALANLDDATESHDELKVQQQTLAERLEKYVADTERLESELFQSQSEHAKELSSIQERFDATTQQLEDLKASRVSLEERQQELLAEVAEAKEKLEQHAQTSTEELESLNAKLRAELDAAIKDRDTSKTDMELAVQKQVDAEAARDAMQQDLAAAQSQLEVAERSLQSLEDEKAQLQCEITALEANVQKATSLQRYLESQIKESEEKIVSLSQGLEQSRAACTKAEKACKVVEDNSSMQTIQSEKAIASLRREIASLRASPKLEETIAELKEQNTEMEELLRKKCQEIEDNDDRFIDMLKEKKKLTSKVESLTRKVQALQSKAASSSSVAAEGPRPPPPALTASGSRQRTTSQPSRPSSSTNPVPPPPPPKSSTSTGLSRVSSGSSAPFRPKAPEVKASPAIFSARTPESKRIALPAETATPEPSSSAGKKRRAPDDFDECEDLPPQPFTSESVPSKSENSTTPRARRVLQSVRSGFTPVRSRANSTTDPSSPSRRVTTAGSSTAAIADVTNSPRSKARMEGADKKKGWLGKIRGAPAGTSRATSSRGPVFQS